GDGRDTIGHIGCALTSVAMYAAGWGLNESPATLNAKLRNVGGFIHQAIVWSAITKLYPQIKSVGLTLCTATPAPVSDISSSVASGQPVIVEVDFSPAGGLQTHWVLLYKNLDSDYMMLDPWPYPSDSGEVTLMSRFSHGRQLQRTIKAVAWYQYSGGVPAPAPAPGPVETDLQVWPLASVTAGLRLRPQPTTEVPAIYAEMPGVRLNVIEEKAAALAKIGKQGQWIRVRDPGGHQGYVAAWFVEVVPTEAPAPTPIPPPASEPKKFQVQVKSSVGRLGVAVRAEPSRGAAKINVEKPGARLTVLEPASTGLAKIGKAGQWLSIKATNNKRGYVAAEYVELL
ncbi:MAG TPA: SH3 domain-containing protein, partial [Anaerolineales bacterium]